MFTNVSSGRCGEAISEASRASCTRKGGAEMTYAVGSLVKARGREWVCPPGIGEKTCSSSGPLGGTEDEVAGVYLPLETVEPATFDLPDPTKRGHGPLLETAA